MGIFEQMQEDAGQMQANAGGLLEQMKADAAAAKVETKPVQPVPPRPTPGYLDTFKNSLVKGAAGFADMIPQAGVNAANLGIATYGTLRGLLGMGDLPDLIPSDKLNGWQKMGEASGLIDHGQDPTNGPGRMIDFTGQVLGGGGVNPASVMRSASRGAILPIVRDVTAATASGLGGGLAAEAARGVNTGSETADTGIKLAAQLAGGMVPGMVLAARGTAGDRAAAAMGNVTPEQLQLAQALQERARAAGTPLTGYEAIQSVTGLNPKMQTQQRIAEQSDAAPGSGLTGMMQDRPGANQAMFENVANGVSPANPFPDTLAGRMQEAASNSIKSAQEARTAEAGPFYQKQRSSDSEAMRLLEQMPSEATMLADRLRSRDLAMQTSGQLSGMSNDMTQAAKDYHPVAGMPGFPARYLPHTDVAAQAAAGSQEAYAVSRQRLQEASDAQQRLDTLSDQLAQKNLPEIQSKVSELLSGIDQKIKVLGPTVEGKFLQSFRDELAPGGQPIVYPSQLESVYRNNRNKLDPGAFASSEDRTRIGVLGPEVQGLNALIKEVSPTIAEGRAAYAQASRNVVDPLKLGQVGKLAQSDSFGPQAETLLPNKPMDITPQVVRRTAKTLNAQDPDIVRQFVAQYLRGQFNEANQQNMAGPNVFGGSKFAAQVAGNPGQDANLMAALQASGANPAQMNDALQIFSAQGMKPAVNSATQANTQEAGQMGNGHKLVDLLIRPLKTVPGAIDSWRNGWATEGLANALTDPQSIQRLQELARLNGSHNPTQQQIMANMLMASKQPPMDYDAYIKAFDAAPDAATKAKLGQMYEEAIRANSTTR